MCDQIRSFLRIWSHLMKKSLMENFIFCAVEHPNVLDQYSLVFPLIPYVQYPAARCQMLF